MHKETGPLPTVATKTFITGFLITGAAIVLMNLLPYLQSRGAHNSDNYEISGFPLIFHRAGGFAFINELYPAALLADTALGFALALAIGYACTRISAYKPPQSPDTDSHG